MDGMDGLIDLMDERMDGMEGWKDENTTREVFLLFM